VAPLTIPDTQVCDLGIHDLLPGQETEGWKKDEIGVKSKPKSLTIDTVVQRDIDNRFSNSDGAGNEGCCVIRRGISGDECSAVEVLDRFRQVMRP